MFKAKFNASLIPFSFCVASRSMQFAIVISTRFRSRFYVLNGNKLLLPQSMAFDFGDGIKSVIRKNSITVVCDVNADCANEK